MQNNKMQIWDKLKKTDPKYTKPFGKFGKELTTVDPQYQIQMMTSMFGPVGKGWKYTVEYKYLDGLVFAEVSIKYYLDSKWYEYGPVCSVQNLSKKNGSLDDEAPKKAMTDAMTKAFSHLGMSADVFLGMFDDSKYVESLKKEFAQKIPKTNGKRNIELDMQLDMDQIRKHVKGINDIFALRKFRKEYPELFDSNKMSLREYRQIEDLYQTQEIKLNRQGVIYG
jgi:uncharacterized short protein YbdD (DUF466 family)